MTNALATNTYASIVSEERVMIALMIAFLSDLEVKSGDILNTYVQALVTEKMWTTFGQEFSKDAEKTVVIVIAIYGLNSPGVAFRSHVAKYMESLGYESCKTDQDLWLKPKIRPEEGLHYYSY